MRFIPRTGNPFESFNVRGFSFNSFEEFPDMSAAVMEVSGWHGLVKAQNTRCFYVLEGRGLFMVGGREYPVEQGDVIFVPKNTPHDINGEMRLFVVHSPAYHPDLVQDLE